MITIQFNENQTITIKDKKGKTIKEDFKNIKELEEYLQDKEYEMTEEVIKTTNSNNYKTKKEIDTYLNDIEQ